MMITYQKKKRKKAINKASAEFHKDWFSEKRSELHSPDWNDCFRANRKGETLKKTPSYYHLWLHLSVCALPVGIIRQRCVGLTWQRRISADVEASAVEAASLFAGSKGKHCAQHVFLIKPSVHHRTSETNWEWHNHEGREREQKRHVAKAHDFLRQIPSYSLLYDTAELVSSNTRASLVLSTEVIREEVELSIRTFQIWFVFLK